MMNWMINRWLIHGITTWYIDDYWLVVWNIFGIFPYIGNVIIPTDFHIFQRGWIWNHHSDISYIIGRWWIWWLLWYRWLIHGITTWYIDDYWLVVWNGIFFIFPCIGNCHHPNWLSYFSEGLVETTNQISQYISW